MLLFILWRDICCSLLQLDDSALAALTLTCSVAIQEICGIAKNGFQTENVFNHSIILLCLSPAVRSQCPVAPGMTWTIVPMWTSNAFSLLAPQVTMRHWANSCSGCTQHLWIKVCVENGLPGRKNPPCVSHMGLMSVGFTLEQAQKLKEEIDVITIFTVWYLDYDFPFPTSPVVNI